MTKVRLRTSPQNSPPQDSATQQKRASWQEQGRTAGSRHRNLGGICLLTEELDDLGFVLIRAVIVLQGCSHDQVAVERAASDVRLIALGYYADKCPVTQVGHGF